MGPDKKKLAKDIGYLSSLSKAGYRSLKQGNIKDAERYFNQILEIDSYNKYALTGMGEVEKKRDRPLQALEYFKTCTEHHENDVPSLNKLAELFWEIEDFSNAALVWDKLLLLSPENDILLSHMGDALRKLGSWDESEKMYKKSLDKNPGDRFALNGISALYYEQNLFSEAISYAQRVVRLEEKNIRALTLIGNCYRKLGSFQEALEYFNRAYAVDRRNFYVLFGLADSYRGLKEHETSLEFWLEILKTDPDNCAILSRAGDAFYVIGDLDSARKYYQDALIKGDSIYSIIGFSKIEQLNGNWAEAHNLLDELFRDNPLNARALLELTKLLLRLSRLDEARKNMDKYLDAGGSPEAVGNIENLIDAQNCQE